MKNQLSDLNNHLFAQLERLGDENLDSDQIRDEAKRARAIVDLSDQILGNAHVQLKAAKLLADHGDYVRANLPMLVKPE